MPPTFDVTNDAFVSLIASGPTGGSAAMVEGLIGHRFRSDASLIGIAASGNTPYVMAGVGAREVGGRLDLRTVQQLSRSHPGNR